MLGALVVSISFWWHMQTKYILPSTLPPAIELVSTSPKQPRNLEV
jgi:hypothetical protein